MASGGKVGSGCAEGTMGRLWKAGVPPKPTDGDDAFAMLGHAVVRRVDLTEVNLVARFKERFEQVKNKLAPPSGKEALNVLEDERTRTMPGDEIRVDLY